tara:strand:+ start:4626 stop:5054 length:429 start_codon:yes stop_codon:yes gene_type:complete
MLMRIIIAIFCIGYSSEYADSILEDEIKIHNFIQESQQKKKEFIVTLKNGEKFKVSEVLAIEEGSYQFNILENKMSKSIFYKNNISRRSNYVQNHSSKVVVKVDLKDIFLVEKISYVNEIKEIRNYTILVVVMYLIFSVFSN